WVSWSTQLISKEYRPPVVLIPSLTGTGISVSNRTAPRSSTPSLPPEPFPAPTAFPSGRRAKATTAKAAYRKYFRSTGWERPRSRSIFFSHSDVCSNTWPSPLYGEAPRLLHSPLPQVQNFLVRSIIVTDRSNVNVQLIYKYF